jgi:hypothetical protein
VKIHDEDMNGVAGVATGRRQIVDVALIGLRPERPLALSRTERT